MGGWGREGGRKLNRGLIARETKDGCAILTVETKVNGDSKSTNERGPSLVGSLGSSCRYKRLLSCFGCSGQPSAKNFFPHRTLFPIAQQPKQEVNRAKPSVYECVSPVIAL